MLEAAEAPEVGPAGAGVSPDPPTGAVPRLSLGALRRSAASGVRWGVVSQFARQGVGFAATAILARLLAPSDYGLMAMVVIVTGFASLFGDLGTSAAVVQRKDVTGRLLSSIFWANVVLGLVAGLLVAASAPAAGAFFREPRVTVLLLVSAPSFLVASVTVVQQALAQREMQFSRLARIEIVAATVGAAAGVAAALLRWGVWSLLVQSYAGALATAAMLWASSRWRPGLAFQWGDVRSVSRYSLNLVGFNTINYWARSADNMLVGRYLGPTPLGLYAMAYRLMQYPLRAVTGVVGRVLFPALSRIQEDDATFRQVYLKTAGFIAVVTFPMMMALLATARPLVTTVLSPKWSAAVPCVMILALVGMNQSIVSLEGNIYTAKGRTDIMLRVGAACTAIYLLGIVLGLRWGIVGVAACYGIADLAATPLAYSFSFRLIGLPMRRLAGPLWRPLLCSGLMAAVLWFSAPAALGVLGKAPGLLTLLLVGGGVYGGATWTLNRAQALDLMRTLAARG